MCVETDVSGHVSWWCVRATAVEFVTIHEPFAEGSVCFSGRRLRGEALSQALQQRSKLHRLSLDR